MLQAFLIKHRRLPACPLPRLLASPPAHLPACPRRLSNGPLIHFVLDDRPPILVDEDDYQALEEVKTQIHPPNSSNFFTYNRYLMQDEHNETLVGLNSNLMTPDFPHNIRIRKAKMRQPTRQRLSSVRMQQKKINLILFLYYEESLMSSNLNSNLLRFHCAHPNVHTKLQTYSTRTDIIRCISKLFTDMSP